MAKVGYIMATSQYDKLEEDRKWMNEFGCVRIIEESDDNERHRPLWKRTPQTAVETADGSIAKRR